MYKKGPNYLLFKMLFLENVWLGILCDRLVKNAKTISEKECPGHKFNSPLLHLCQQLSLYEKLAKYFEPAKGDLFKNLEREYTEIEDIVPHSENPEEDKKYYLEFGRNFLLSVTPDAVYFGRYVSEENDHVINIKKQRKAKKIKTNC